MTKPWNQAAWKQNTYRNRVEVKPVGDEALNRGGVDTVCCKRCGYYVHAPSCPSQRARQTTLPKPPDVTKEWKVRGVDESFDIDEATRQCVQFKQVVRVVEDAWEDDCVYGWLIRYAGHCNFECSADNGASWKANTLPAFDRGRLRGMRFEVVR